jgi:secreted PhoX family phosphatase
MAPDGQVYPFARNVRDTGEFAGACFAPDGTTLFCNLQRQGVTVAITGPWPQG